VKSILSLHIPKTAGSSFYQLLKANYPGQISESLRREHLMEMKKKGLGLRQYLPPGTEVIHGHVTAAEALDVIREEDPLIIAFFRDPADRVISNYCYFIDLLKNPEQKQQNPAVYEINKHRIHESIYEYAEMEENRNVMSKYLAPLRPNDLFFCGLMEQYAADVQRLATRLGWQHKSVDRINVKAHLRREYVKETQDLRFFLRKMNADDVALYKEVQRLRKAR